MATTAPTRRPGHGPVLVLCDVKMRIAAVGRLISSEYFSPFLSQGVVVGSEPWMWPFLLDEVPQFLSILPPPPSRVRHRSGPEKQSGSSLILPGDG